MKQLTTSLKEYFCSKYFVLATVTLVFGGCVTNKKFEIYKIETSNTISVLNDEISMLKKRMKSSEKENTEQNQSIDDINGNISTLRNTQNDLKNKITAQKNEVKSLQNELSDVKDKVVKVQKDVINLEDRIQIIEAYKREQEFIKNNLISLNSPGNLSSIDDYVLNLNITETSSSSYQNIVEKITANSQNNYEKARAIFIWLANNIAYDVNLSIYDADNTFYYRRGVCAGYSGLFEKFCKIAGLSVVTITGVAKDLTYRVGENLANNAHAWNAIQDDNGRWVLVDATWGAGHVSNGVFTRKIASYWFDSDPYLFALSHFPDNDEMQMIKIPLNNREFQIYPPIYPSVALMGLKGEEVLNHLRDDEEHSFPVMYTFDGLLKINEMPLKAKLNSGVSYKFSFTTMKDYKVALIQGKTWVNFVDNGENKYLEFTPTYGNEVVIAINNGGTADYSYVFVYRVE